MAKSTRADFLKKYPFAVAEYLDRAEVFREIFAPFFPHLDDDFERCLIELERLESGFFGNPIETVRSKEAFADLEKLERYLRFISKLTIPYWKGFLPRPSGWEDRKRTDPVDKYDIFDFVFHLSEEENGEDAIKGFVIEAKTEIARLPEMRNIKWDAVNAVNRLRTLWWRNTGFDGPLSLNPASPFAEFLACGFTFLELEADPISAFKRWAIEFGE